MEQSFLKRVRNFVRPVVPRQLKKLFFAGGFSLMSESERDVVRRSFHMASVEWSLRNIAALGFKPRQIVDVGAYVGGWTRMVKSIFPEARVLMIEAQREREGDLRRVCGEFAGSVDYRMSLLGPTHQERAAFYQLETGSSVLFEQSSIERTKVEYEMRTLDDVAIEAGFAEVDFLKLDVQGYELEVLKGASRMFSDVQVILMEVSLLGVNKGAPLLREVIEFMASRGFRVYDICSLIRRPLDGALWQSDLLFVREGHPLLASESFD
jgi:FkbM family methyltransferase